MNGSAGDAFVGASDAGGKRILVIGGAGLVGAPIVRQLCEAGWTVRVMSRKAAAAAERLSSAVEIVSGDATRAAELEPALSDCQAVLVCVSDWLDPYLDVRVTENVVQVASGQGIERIGLVTGASVSEARRSFPLIDAKLRAEALLKAGGIPWVILRPSWPMESLAQFAPGRHAVTFGRQPAEIRPVAGVDIGRLVGRAFELDEALGRTFTIHGPEAFTMKAWLERYCSLTGRPTRVTTIPLWALGVAARLRRKQSLQALLELMRHFDAGPGYGDPSDTNRLLGAPTITLEEWVTDQARA